MKTSHKLDIRYETLDLRVVSRLIISILISICLTSHISSAQTWVKIPDAAFANYLLNNIPTAMQGDSLNTSSILVTTTTHSLNLSSLGISNLSGVQYFTSLTSLDCDNNVFTSLPAPLPNTLTYLDCSYCPHITGLPILPTSLQTLWCQDDSLISLPVLPNTLQTIFCFNNYLTTLPALPASLQSLYCYSNALTSLPALNSSLTQLYCYYNNLTSFPAFSNALVFVDCHDNYITSFPSFNNSLTNLTCSNNALTNLPALPNSLTYLDCSYNQVTNLPTLPNALSYLDCSYNQITTLPALPQLTQFYCDSNNISCFPVFPNSIQLSFYSSCIRQWIYYINISSNPFTCVPNYVAGMGSDSLTYTKCTAGNANGCTVTGINELKVISDELKVYPNPAKDVLNVESSMINENSTLLITDMLGNAVKQSIIYNLESIINVSDLSEGVYNLTISGKEGIANKRLVIER
jgi:Leucine-rich repeat (LRR) protein